MQEPLTISADPPGSVFIEVARWGEERAWVGADPYEGLNTTLGRLAPSRRARQAAVQLYKRLPVTPPWPLRATPEPNAKALALALSAYSTRAGRTLPQAERWLGALPAQLERLNLADGDQAAWGYPFDAQTRHLFYDRTTPNAIATCFVVDALLDAADATSQTQHAELALRARPFLLSLGSEHAGRPYFSYVRAGSELIHNANLMVCGALARLQGVDPDEEAATAVRATATTTIELQRPDGLWPYGEATNLQWADNFHTAYVLDGLSAVSGEFGIGSQALRRGIDAWWSAFFEPDGWARYFPRSRYPLEAHSCASAIDLLCALGEPDSPDAGHSFIERARHVADTAIRELWMPDAGRFAFRRTARGRNGRAFMRWTNAPMFRALARLVSRDDSLTDSGVSSLKAAS